MPLNQACSLKAFQSNISEEIKSGKPKEQAFAIAISTLKKACGVESEKRMTVDEILKGKSESVKVFRPELAEGIVRAVLERQKTQPNLGQEMVPGTDKPVLAQQGSFKLSSQSLSMFAKMGIEPEDTLFKDQARVMMSIPREKLPQVIGCDNIPDAQDELARHPRKVIKAFLVNIHNVSPKAGKMLRAVPENAALYFYIYAMLVSGRDMADEILKRYLTTDQYFRPKTKKEDLEQEGCIGRFDRLGEARKYQ